MSPALGVKATPQALSHGAAATLASLPLSFTTTHSRAEVVLIDGAEGWPERVADAAREGARVVVVLEPTAPGDHEPVAIPTILDQPYAGNPALPAIAENVALADVAGLLEIRAIASVGSSRETVLRSLLSLLRAAAGRQLEGGEAVVTASDGLIVRGSLGDGRPVLITSTVTDALPECATIRLVAARSTFEATLPTANAARPARVVRFDENGARRWPELWETSHRVAVRRARDLLRGDTDDRGDDLAEFAADAELAHRLLTTTQSD